MKTPEEIILQHYSCVCDKMYKSRGLSDPDCVLCQHGSEMALIAKEYHAQFTATSEELEKAKEEFIIKWKYKGLVEELMLIDLDSLLAMRREEKPDKKPQRVGIVLIKNAHIQGV